MAVTDFNQLLGEAQGRLPNRSTGDGGSALVAGLGVVAGVGVEVANAAAAQRATNKTNEILGVLTQGDGVDETSSGISQSEVSDVRKAQLAVEQGRPGAISKRTATLIKRVKKLKADGRTELEIAESFRIAGISDPRLAGLQEASDAETRQSALNDDLKLRFVQGAGISYQLDEDGNPAGSTGKDIDIEVSFAKAQKDKIAFDDLTQRAAQNYQANVESTMDGMNSLISGQLGPAMREIDTLTKDGRVDGEGIAGVQNSIRDIIANLEVRKGEFLSGIPDKANRDDAAARFDALIAPYKEFVIGDADPSVFQNLANKNRLVTQADKVNFGRANPAFREILNSNPELAKVMAQSIAFRTLETTQDPRLSKTFGTYLNGLMGAVENSGETDRDGAPLELPTEFKSPEMAKIGSRELVSTLASVDPEAISSSVKEIIHNGQGTGLSKFEIDIRSALNPQATAKYTPADRRETFERLWSNPKINVALDELAKTDPDKAQELGSMITGEVNRQFQDTTDKLRNQSGYLESWLVDVNPKTGNFELKFKDGRGTSTVDNSTRGRLSGLLGVAPSISGTAFKEIKAMDKYVNTLMRNRKYDRSVAHLSDADARKFYQESALLFGASTMTPEELIANATPARNVSNLGSSSPTSLRNTQITITPEVAPAAATPSINTTNITNTRELSPLMRNASDEQLKTLANESSDPLILQAAQDELASRKGK